MCNPLCRRRLRRAKRFGTQFLIMAILPLILLFDLWDYILVHYLATSQPRFRCKVMAFMLLIGSIQASWSIWSFSFGWVTTTTTTTTTTFPAFLAGMVDFSVVFDSGSLVSISFATLRALYIFVSIMLYGAVNILVRTLFIFHTFPFLCSCAAGALALAWV